jgi:hypothetical protein
MTELIGIRRDDRSGWERRVPVPPKMLPTSRGEASRSYWTVSHGPLPTRPLGHLVSFMTRSVFIENIRTRRNVR